jgi:EAL domain-containing protein (putative c-di-GMP-specific phosphodiesterase class I)
VVRLDTRATHHFEALIRPVPDPANPGQSVQDFVSYAEAVGLSEQLDLAVVEEVTATLARSRDVRAAANISGLSMQSADFRDRLLALVPVDGRLLIELTETADITDTEAAAATIAALRAAGVDVAIDDFGAGSAAFRYLRDFRVDHVKIDGSYVRAARDSARDRDLVAAMRDTAHGLGAAVIAEMIETEETAALMARLGVTFGQGYLFGRPGHLPGARG